MMLSEQSEPRKSDNRFTIAISIIIITCYVILLVVGVWLLIKYSVIIREWAISLLPETPDLPDAFSTRPEDVVKVAPEVTIAIYVVLTVIITVLIVWLSCRYLLPAARLTQAS